MKWRHDTQNNIWHNNTQHNKKLNTKFSKMQNIVMLSVSYPILAPVLYAEFHIQASPLMLNVIMLNVVMVSVGVNLTSPLR
jgi:hypothetical protein